jgi:hypothetical protein
MEKMCNKTVTVVKVHRCHNFIKPFGRLRDSGLLVWKRSTGAHGAHPLNVHIFCNRFSASSDYLGSSTSSEKIVWRTPSGSNVKKLAFSSENFTCRVIQPQPTDASRALCQLCIILLQRHCARIHYLLWKGSDHLHAARYQQWLQCISASQLLPSLSSSHAQRRSE